MCQNEQVLSLARQCYYYDADELQPVASNRVQWPPLLGSRIKRALVATLGAKDVHA